MADCTKPDPNNLSISQQLLSLGPRTVEGDQGRVSMHSVHDAIAALEYERKRNLLNNKAAVTSAIRTISGHRFSAPGGRAS